MPLLVRRGTGHHHHPAIVASNDLTDAHDFARASLVHPPRSVFLGGKFVGVEGLMGTM